MIIKGVSEIKGIRSLNTRTGPICESSGLLNLYQLAAEKENLMKKLKWINGQKDQAEKRLSEIEHSMQVSMHVMKKTVEQKTERESASNSPSESHTMFIKY